MRAKILGLTGAALGAVLAFSAPASADIVANDPALANYTLQYGDFSIVSLGFAFDATGNSAYNVQSSAGLIRDDIVVGTGAGGSFYNGTPGGTATTLPPCVSPCLNSDAPYETPNGVGGAYYFRTGNPTSAPDPGTGGEFTGDSSASWDISVSALQTYLNGQAPVFYFNLNETGVDDLISGTDLLVWVKMTLTSSTGFASKDFYVAGGPLDPAGALNGKNLSITFGGPDETIVPTDVPAGSNIYTPDPRWTLVHGDICVTGSTFLHYGKCVGGEPAGAHSVLQDLGSEQAAFAGYSNPLNEALATGNYDMLHIDWRMTGLDNGFEQLFILAGGTPTIVPEPFTMSVFGAGIVGIGLLRRRKAGKSKA